MRLLNISFWEWGCELISQRYFYKFKASHDAFLFYIFCFGSDAVLISFFIIFLTFSLFLFSLAHPSDLYPCLGCFLIIFMFSTLISECCGIQSLLCIKRNFTDLNCWWYATKFCCHHLWNILDKKLAMVEL